MRKITDVIDQISALIPISAPAPVADELAVLQAELRIIRRTAMYAAPESTQAEELWTRLSIVLYRYLPNPAGFVWAQQISDLITQ